jgi:FKBP-type peptidyl-prolyl cis-trans isomerase
MRHIASCGFVILLSMMTSLPLVQGQTKRITSRSIRTRAVKPVKAAAKYSAATTTPSGLIYVITRRSEGRKPRPGENVIVNYTGLLTNGVKFDSSIDRGQPFKFQLGVGRVIKGWDEGIEKLRVGEQATLVIPPQLAYGATGSGNVIPPQATLIFVVELIGIEEPPAE